MAKFTQEMFENKVREIHGDRLTVAGKYISTSDKIDIQCNYCGDINNLLAKSVTHVRKGYKPYHCRKCFKIDRTSLRIGIDEVGERLLSRYGESLTFDLDGFQILKDTIVAYCTDCGYRKRNTAQAFIDGVKYKCKVCKKNSGEINQKEFLLRVERSDNTRFDVVESYSGASDNIKIRCKDCGEYREVISHKIYNAKVACIKCDKESEAQKAHEKFVSKVDTIYNGKFKVVSKYNGSNNPISLRCTDCGYIRRLSSANNAGRGEGCVSCNGVANFTTKEIKEQIADLTDGEYELIGEYINAQVSFRVRHNSENCHFYEFNTILGNFTRQGRRCPECTFEKSKGESLIQMWLESKNIHYEPQYRYNDCRNKRPLPFDFAVFNEDKNVEFLIEFDGKQHFEATSGFWGDKNPTKTLKRVQKNDSIKNAYCIENNIRLIRIPYFDINKIEMILEKELLRNNEHGEFEIKQVKL